MNRPPPVESYAHVYSWRYLLKQRRPTDTPSGYLYPDVRVDIRPWPPGGTAESGRPIGIYFRGNPPVENIIDIVRAISHVTQTVSGAVVPWAEVPCCTYQQFTRFHEMGRCYTDVQRGAGWGEGMAVGESEVWRLFAPGNADKVNTIACRRPIPKLGRRPTSDKPATTATPLPWLASTLSHGRTRARPMTSTKSPSLFVCSRCQGE